ncbi:SUN domain-containing protein 1-like isoform X2 [Takifugu rubripes]|uniref:SUN domain-containing protein 1-like isoform X2 n=1 Tax=Takifugu rubripes TaxID=31033 RepID=UPI0011453198|nr:SUN domain-containing protein 1-like isoform X2 [Takifugu rubripes]
MSRRSLRLDDGLLDRSLPHSSASFSVGGASWRSSRSGKCRGSRQLSLSCSESLLMDSPYKLNSSDASLLSSLVEDSSIRENTLVDSYWGLDHDMDPKESTIIADQSTVLADHTLVGPDDCDSREPVQALTRFYCHDCEPNMKESTCSISSPPSCTTAPRASAPGSSEISTVYSRVRKHKAQRDVLQLWLDWCLLAVRRAALCCVFLFSHIWQVCRERLKVQSEAAGAPKRHSGVMSLKEPRQNQDLHPNGALCDDCEEKLRSETLPSPSRSPVISSLLVLTRSAAAVTGKTTGHAFRWFRRHQPCVTSDLLTWPVLVLILLLLLFSLCWFSPAVLPTLLPAADVADTLGLNLVADLTSSLSQSDEGVTGERREVQEHLHSEPPAEVHDESRLVRLEQSVTALWEQVEAGGRRAEQRHREVMKLYTEVLQGGGGGGAWLTSMMEHQLQPFRALLDQKGRQALQRQSRTSRVDRLESQLQALAARTEELQSKQEAGSVGGTPRLQDGVLAQVERLEAALEDVGRDVARLLGHGDEIQQTISSQIRDGIQAQIYGSQLTEGGGASADVAPPASLLQWLSQHYVSRADLQVALASLELSILQNISRQLEGNVRDGTGAAVSREDVRVIVDNALRRFSEDRTGMSDFALESGGGSVLVARCSETYRTKVALLSLFGFPLWYFSQSPRAVIQPDVNPGNCWAFRGSSGYLVIRLSMPIFPTAVTLEHTPKALTPSGKMDSAPRDFSVYGLDDENQERGQLLGAYTYDQDGEAVQTFTVTEVCDRPFQMVEIQVTSNWGHPEYTCLYRVRVHGTPADT